MAKKIKKEQLKKTIRMSIFSRLDAAFSEYHSLVGEKKFTKHLKKTAKLFANDIADATKKEQEKAKKEAKKNEMQEAGIGLKKKEKKAKKNIDLVISEAGLQEMEKPAK